MSTQSTQPGGQPDGYWTRFLRAENRELRGRFRTRALIAGEGEPLLLIHGTGGHFENYARNIEAYARHFRVIAIDLLWHGRSQTTGFDAQLFPGFLAQIDDVLSVLGIERVHIEGQSLGGWVAALWAARNPARVGKLVLVTAMGYAPAALGRIDYGAMGPEKLRDANLAVLENPVWDNIRTRMARILAAPETLTDEAIAVRHALYNDPALNAVQRQVTMSYFSDAVAPFALSDAVLGAIRAPTLVYWGDKNPSPPEVGQAIARAIPNGRFYCAANTGHWAQFENAAEHNREVLAFLTGRI